MKKYGDTVLFRRGTITVNALVLQSSVQPDGEHLTIVYLDPAFASPILGGSAAQQAVATAFTVPLKEGQVQGWLDAETISEHDLRQIQANSADNQAKDDSEWEKKVEALEAQLKELQKAYDTVNSAHQGAFQRGSDSGFQAGGEAVLSATTVIPIGKDQIHGAAGTHNDLPAVIFENGPGAVILEFHDAESTQVLIEDLAAMYPGGGPTPVPPPPPTQ